MSVMTVINLVSDDEEEDCIFVKEVHVEHAVKVEKIQEDPPMRPSLDEVPNGSAVQSPDTSSSSSDSESCGLERTNKRKNEACPVCKKLYRNPACLSAHIKLHSKTRKIQKYFCAQCFHGSPTKSKLLRHILTHVKKGPFPCATCGCKFKTKGKLKMHVWRHNAVRCKFCENKLKVFKNNLRLLQHMLEFHKMTEKHAAASILWDDRKSCDSNRDAASTLKTVHATNTSTGDRKSEATSVAGRKIKKQKKRARPPSIEDDEDVDEPPFEPRKRTVLPSKMDSMRKCDICGMLFININLLTRHLKFIHFGCNVDNNNEEPEPISAQLKMLLDEQFQCIICAQTFHIKSDLRKHMSSNQHLK